MILLLRTFEIYIPNLSLKEILSPMNIKIIWASKWIVGIWGAFGAQILQPFTSGGVEVTATWYPLRINCTKKNILKISQLYNLFYFIWYRIWSTWFPFHEMWVAEWWWISRSQLWRCLKVYFLDFFPSKRQGSNKKDFSQ